MRDRAPKQLLAATTNDIAPAAPSPAGTRPAKTGVRATAQVRRAVWQVPPGVFLLRAPHGVQQPLQPAFSAAVRACSEPPVRDSIRAPATRATVRDPVK